MRSLDLAITKGARAITGFFFKYDIRFLSFYFFVMRCLLRDNISAVKRQGLVIRIF